MLQLIITFVLIFIAYRAVTSTIAVFVSLIVTPGMGFFYTLAMSILNLVTLGFFSVWIVTRAIIGHAGRSNG